MGFERFQKNKAPNITEPLITILKRRLFGINRACHDKYFKEYKFVNLLYDRKEKLIGFERTNKEGPDSYEIRRKGIITLIAGSLFLKSIGHTSDVSRTYAPRWDGKNKLVVIEMSGYLFL